MSRSIRSFNLPPAPPAIPGAFDLLKIGSLKFPLLYVQMPHSNVGYIFNFLVKSMISDHDFLVDFFFWATLQDDTRLFRWKY